MPLRALRSHPFFLYRLPGTALVVIACAVVVVLTVGLSAAFAWRDRQATLQHAGDVAGNVSLLVAEHAARLIETSDLILKLSVALAGQSTALQNDRATWERFAGLAQSMPYLVSIWVTDADGRVVMNSRQFPPPDLTVADRDYFRAHREGTNTLQIHRLDSSRASGEPLIVLSRPLAVAPGSFRGVAVLAVAPRHIDSLYRAFDVGYARAITLRRSDGTILLREAGADGAGEDDQAITAQRRVDGTDLLAEVAIPTAGVIADWRARLWLYAAYGLAAVAAVTIIGMLAVERTRRERKAEDALQHAHDTLEERVHRRTAELEETNARLESAVTDKEVLLKEVQHRVKNNLQVICSLLRLQASRIDDPTRRVFDESLRRIQAMSLLHELMHRAEQPDRIDLADYLQQLCDGLVRSANPTGARLTVEAEAWTVDVDQATPLALIASELVSNALRHAFPAGHPAGTVAVELRTVDDAMRLTVRDDGVGLPPGVSLGASPVVKGAQRRNGGLGLVLVQALAQQLGARVAAERGVEMGTLFTVTVPANGARRPKAA